MGREPEAVAVLRCVLREQLVTFRKAADLTQGQLAGRVFVDRTTVTHLERGRGTGALDLWQALDAALDARGALVRTYLDIVSAREESERRSRDSVLAEARARADQLRHGPSGQPPDGDRGPVRPVTALTPSVVGGLAEVDVGGGSDEFLAGVSVQTPVPGRVGWSDVEHVRSTTRAVATAENVFGGGLSCEAALGQLRWAGKLLNARADGDVRRAMFEAVGNLSSVVAYSAFDVSAYEAADRCFQFALWCADHSGSWALRANTLAEMSRKAAYLDDLDEALSLIEFAQVRSDRLTNRARAMLCTLRARLLALTNRHDEARGDIARADAHFHDGLGEDDPPWLTYYDHAEHQGSIGKALIPTAVAERDLEVAAPRLREAIASHRESYPRSRAFSRTRLATLAMEIGDPHEAVTIGRQLLVEVGPLRSDRITRELRGLAQVATQHARIGAVDELRHDILTLTPPKARQ